ncbi:MAG: Phosphoribosylamine--glycine ligase [Verrucomicrobiales bacterium]|nr:Phosphoribosylamine--glycine ligase [Verrucomicrobiales bacterium]
MLHILKGQGADVETYLTRDYGHYGPGLEGKTHLVQDVPDVNTLLDAKDYDLIIPQSIDWAQKDWGSGLVDRKAPILCPSGEALKLERDRDFARALCGRYRIPFPRSYVARNRIEAEAILAKDPRPYVLKNPLCSPTSPIHTIVCETVTDTQAWLRRVDYAEGAFMQEYMGRAEAGHIAFVSGGEIYSLITNQEYKRAFNGDMGIVAGAPLGGLVESDPGDKYGLARELIHPLLPWFREVDFHGPIQVTGIKRDGKWSVLEYNVRLGVTCGPVILRMLQNPLDDLIKVVKNKKLKIDFNPGLLFGCSLTLAGYGYPFVALPTPPLPVDLISPFDCDVWWNEVALDSHEQLVMTGHRIADIVAIAETLEDAIKRAYSNIARIRCLSSYYRTDVGKSLWPPGEC